MNRTQNAYDHWSDLYDIDLAINPHVVLETEDVISLVSPSRGDYILDAACGTGRYCRIFKEKGASVIGIDFSEGMLRVARRNMPDIGFLCGDLANPLPFPDSHFDKVNCAQALKHLVNLQPPISEFRRVLKPHGTLTFSVTHPEIDWTGYEMRNRPSLNLSAESDIYHHRFYNYFEAIEHAGLRLSAFRQVAVDEKIRSLLTAESYQIVQGRYQIAIFQAVKGITQLM